MTHKFFLLIVPAVLAALSSAPRALAQQLKPGPTPSSYATPAPDVLPGLPRPPDAPASLLKEAPAARPYSCEPLPGPYFEQDARLDPPEMPQPGWFTDVEIGVVGPHVKNRLRDTVQIGNAAPAIVHVPGADLDWTIAPRVEVGYRLPSGFGEFAFSYRFFGTDGTGTTPGLDTTTALRSRLSVNIVDVDYASRAFSTLQWPYVDLKWRFGLRWADAFFDARAVEPFTAAAAGSGIFNMRTSNNFWGIGPHAGLELTRPFEGSGLAVVGRVDGATLLGRIRQGFFETSTAVGPDGQLLTGNTRLSVSQSVPILSTFLGLSWEPPGYPHMHFSAGLQYEYWWNVGRNSNTLSRGELSDQGVLLRAELNY